MAFLWLVLFAVGIPFVVLLVVAFVFFRIWFWLKEFCERHDFDRAWKVIDLIFVGCAALALVALGWAMYLLFDSAPATLAGVALALVSLGWGLLKARMGEL